MAKLRLAPDLALPEDVVTSTVVVYGGKGMGKTNLGSVLVEELTKAHLRWCVLDPMGVWWGLRHSKDGKGPGVECVILGGAHGDIPIEPTGGAIVADLVVDEQVNTIIDFSRKANGKMWSKGERIRFVTDYITRLFERQGELVGGRRREPMMQILDEAARYVPQTIPANSPMLAECVGAWEQAAEEGRNIGLGLGLLTQRSARMNKSVSELADVMLAFRTIGPNSLSAIMDWLGEHVEKAHVKELATQVRELNVGHALVVSPGWLRLEKVVQIRERETFDSSATPKPGQSSKRVTGAAAKPDLAAYQQKMAATIEKVKADDPKALRQRIAELERAVKTAPAKSIEKPVADPRAIDRAVADTKRQLAAQITNLRKALEAAMKFIINVSTLNFDVAGVDKAELERAITAAVVKAAHLIDQRLDAREKSIEQLRQQATSIVGKLQAALGNEEVVIAVDVAKNEPFTVSPSPARRAPAPRPASTVPADGVTVPQQRILDALATFKRLNSYPVAKGNVAAFSDASPTSSSFANNLGRLRSLGFIDYPGDGKVELTTSGEAIARSDDEINSVAQLHEKWSRLLPLPRWSILQALIGRHPQPVAREQLAEMAGASVTSSSYANNLGALRSLGLIDYRKASDGTDVVATNLLYPEGLY